MHLFCTFCIILIAAISTCTPFPAEPTPDPPADSPSSPNTPPSPPINNQPSPPPSPPVNNQLSPQLSPPINNQPSPPSHPSHSAGKTLSDNVPNPDSQLDQYEREQMLKTLLKDPVLRQRIEQLQGPINEEIAKDTSSGCMSVGSRFQTINLKMDHDEHDSDDDGGTNKKKWKHLNANKYYGVKRDRFFVQNVDGGMMSVQFQRGEPKTSAVVRGTESDWDSEYVLAKADAFWSMDNNYGAQHALGKQTYPFELQLVHFRKDLKSLAAAAAVRHGILVLSVLFEASGKPNPSMEPLAAAAVQNLFPSDKPRDVHGPLDIKALLPFDLTNMQYTGAYMSQPCSKDAKWVVFRHPRHIAYKQLKKFREMRDSGGRKNPGVFVPIQQESTEIEVRSSRHVRLNILPDEEISHGIKAAEVSGLFKMSYYLAFLYFVHNIAIM